MPRLQGRARLIVPVVIGLVLLILAITVYVNIYSDLLWFRSVDFSTVFTRRLETQIVLFIVFGLLMALIVGANIFIAYRTRPPFRPMSAEQQQLEMLSNALARVRRWVFIGVLLVIGLFTGSAAAGRWSTWMLWRNAVDFGTK